MSAPGTDYFLFGLRVRSEVELPELTPVAGQGEPDVWVRAGSIDLADGGPGLRVHDGAFLLTIEKIARYLVSGGTDILVEPVAGVDPRNVRIFLLGSAFGALLHQRGLLPLHANAVEIGDKAVAFMGESGAGKSTLAAWFHDHGYRVLADDVCAVHFGGSGAPSVFPGLPRLRLWLDAVDRSGRESGGLARSYVGAGDSSEKFDVPVERSTAPHRDIPLVALFLLERGEKFAVEPLIGVAAAEALFAHTYRGSFIASTGDAQKHWASVHRLVETTPIYRVARRWDYRHFDQDFAKILAEVGRMASPRDG